MALHLVSTDVAEIESVLGPIVTVHSGVSNTACTCCTPAPRLTNAEIDRYFAAAGDTIREVGELLRPVLMVPASARGLVIG